MVSVRINIDISVIVIQIKVTAVPCSRKKMKRCILCLPPASIKIELILRETGGIDDTEIGAVGHGGSTD